MAEVLSTEELQAALTRADQLSLDDGAVALQSARVLPDDVDGVEPTTLDTAGADQHGAVYSYTRGQVADALRQLGEEPPATVREGEQARAREAEGEGQTKSDLQRELRELGEPTSGNKDELAKRLAQAHREREASQQQEQQP
jgi:hypothetical protein